MAKAKSIYVFGAEPQAGKSVVLLGIMELLSRHVQKLGFFRPLVRQEGTNDDAIRLISNRYHLPFPNGIKYGITYEKASALMAEEKYGEVLTRILEEYGSLQSGCDVVVCLGTGFHDIPPGTGPRCGAGMIVAVLAGLPAAAFVNVVATSMPCRGR